MINWMACWPIEENSAKASMIGVRGVLHPSKDSNRTKTIYMIFILVDGRMRRYGDMLSNGEFSKKYPGSFLIEGRKVKDQISSIRNWVSVHSVMDC